MKQTPKIDWINVTILDYVNADNMAETSSDPVIVDTTTMADVVPTCGNLSTEK